MSYRITKRAAFVAALCAVLVAILAFHFVATVRTSGIKLTRDEFNLLLRQAMAGDGASSDRLADYYMYGERDYGLALLFRERAALQGVGHSKNLLRDYLDRY